MAVTQSGRRATSWLKSKIASGGSFASLARFPRSGEARFPGVTRLSACV